MCENTSNKKSNTSELGRLGEAAACRYLRRKGFKISARNWRCRLGEIDIVAHDGPDLVFIEVKTRRRVSAQRSVFDNITAAKTAKLRQLAYMYLSRYRRKPPPHRIDIVAVLLDPEMNTPPAIEHIKAAV
ncbi:MAG: YraN family protein [Bdellovibrionales bacterium]|nr:YraN family protein [Bdellovibrionales bacterium]